MVLITRWFAQHKLDKPVRAAAAVAGTLLVVSVLLPACTPQETADDRLTVAVTLQPQAAFVEAVGGDLVRSVVMVPPGASPHTYEPTPDQMVQLSKARVYVKVGTPVEFELAWMSRLTEMNRDMLVVDCSGGISLIEAGEADQPDSTPPGAAEAHGHAGADPHIWLSVRNAKIMVENICAGLVMVDPANEDYYRANCNRYSDELAQLDEELTERLRPFAGKSFIVFHPSFGYFARDYHLVQVAVEQGGAEPDAQYMMRLIETARANDIRVVFVAPQVSARSAEVIAAEIGGTVVVIDPLARDYIPNMRAIADALLRAL